MSAPTTQAGATSADEKTPGQIARDAFYDGRATLVWADLAEASIKDWERAAGAVHASRSPSPAVVPESVRRAFATYDADPGSTEVYRHCQSLAYNFVRTLIADAPPSGRAAEGGETIVSQPVAEALAEFQRRNGYHKPVIEELLTEFGELLLTKIAPTPPASAGDVDGDLTALAEAASVAERAYGILWRLTAFDSAQCGYAHDARKVLLAAMDKESQRRGIAWATRQYGPLGPNPNFMLSDEDRMEMGL